MKPIAPFTPGGNDKYGYTNAHANLKNRYGKANSYLCDHCLTLGKLQDADDWAYKGGAPDERKSPDGKPYSGSLRYYRPLCRPCHTRYDRVRDTITNL